MHEQLTPHNTAMRRGSLQALGHSDSSIKAGPVPHSLTLFSSQKEKFAWPFLKPDDKSLGAALQPLYNPHNTDMTVSCRRSSSLLAVSSANFLWGRSVPSPHSATRMSSKADSTTNLRATTLGTCCCQDAVPLITVLWTQTFSPFSAHLTVLLRKLHFVPFSMSVSRKEASWCHGVTCKP